eukprot:2436561-Rhodomonas_salina.4
MNSIVSSRSQKIGTAAPTPTRPPSACPNRCEPTPQIAALVNIAGHIAAASGILAVLSAYVAHCLLHKQHCQQKRRQVPAPELATFGADFGMTW